MRAAEATRQLSIACAFAALVCIATMGFSVYIPSTRGYFNLGETMVYASALLFGPMVGALAGGVGSMLADLLLGYYHYAPATLLIKALEGLVVGLLGRRIGALAKSADGRRWRPLAATIGILLGALIGLIGPLYYSGHAELYSGIASAQSPISAILIPPEFWLGLGGLASLSMIAIALAREPGLGLEIAPCLAGGSLMVLGYFLYEQLFLGVLALAEVPINVGQMAIGAMAAAPIARAIRRALPRLGWGRP
ncbi:MAG: ECF transporter S component [Candidatus Bathyarchaeia archaeon]